MAFVILHIIDTSFTLDENKVMGETRNKAKVYFKRGKNNINQPGK